MGLFDFVENFFFIGLALLFVLVLLLVYHFKQRMNSVEKKGDNMYDLLTNVVKELRNIRTNMIGETVPVSVTNSPSIITNNIYENIHDYKQDIGDVIDIGDVVDTEDENSDNESQDIERYTGEYSEESEDETVEDGITYQIIDSYRNNVGEKRVVVSDNSDSDSEEDSDSDSDRDSDSDAEDNHVAVETYTEDIPLETDEVATQNVVYVENPAHSSFNDLNTIIPIDESIEEIPLEIEETQTQLASDAPASISDDIQPISRDNADKSSLYKKMSVSQLRALAIQNGIQGDTSKLKKNALVDLLVEKQA